MATKCREYRDKMNAIKKKIRKNKNTSPEEKMKIRSDLWKSYKRQNKLVKALKSQLNAETKKLTSIKNTLRNLG